MLWDCRDWSIEMKALVIYESMFGNTKLIAEAIGKGLGGPETAQVVEVKDAGRDLTGFDLLVIGGPTHAWSMSRRGTRRDALSKASEDRPGAGEIGIREWLGELPRNGSVLTATFDTKLRKGRWFPTGSAARSAAKRLRKRGFTLVFDPEQFEVIGNDGPLADGEIERAEAWGQLLRAAADRQMEAAEPVLSG